MISAVWDLHLDQYQAEYTKQKEDKLLIYRTKWKIHFAICFVHKRKKNLTFRVDIW